ncbi:putative cytochrome p450 oxidoreductase - protein [Eutypa lata UCREL1]|uniref:Putative cytochrome p450 oxidoreductase-protein n=1 Tax=Eutypa lata (strain UCR-EL1) TaxID=1287681 RepID=M7TVJ4_EUTLA|nr:putative cytochrome p450 oxidoreductase - protein [Eutypa lata UCREL1]
MAETIPIPGPPGLPLIGNPKDIDLNNTVQSFISLSETYGPIFKLYLGGSERIFVTDHELANELCSRKDFVKKITGTTEHLAKVMPDGILTAQHGQESWGLTRRTLNPAFTKASVKDMFPEMLDITSQLVLKWARFGSESEFDAQADFTRLSMDTIALLHDENVHFIRTFCSDLVNQRRANPTDKKDIFNALLNRRDPVTGKELSHGVITDNMITFLFAAHLIMNPEAYAKVQEEIDRVMGPNAITPDYINQLPYVKACLRETLRLEPPSPALVLMPIPKDQDCVVIGNKYLIRDGQTTVVLIAKLHRDPATFGPDAEEFRPERMLEENLRKLPKNAFKPFGNGARSCIGSEFALQQATMVLAVLFQKFDFSFANPYYQLQYQPSLHRKAKDLYIKARLRPNIDIMSLHRDLFPPSA